MKLKSLFHAASAAGYIALLVCFAITMTSVPAQGQSLFRQLSQDSFTNQSSQHMTEVEPGAFAWGPTIVTAFQVGRISGGGGADIGFATSTNGGISWINGYLPGMTTYGGGGTNTAASDAAVVYDAKHGVWLICTLPIGNDTYVAVSRSTDGIHWDNPIYVTRSGSPDKNWINCDNTPTSPYYGNCYAEWDSTELGDFMQMSTSSDGGQTWGPAKGTAGNDYGIGGNPVVLPSGKVVVPFGGFNGDIQSFSSSDGGQTWTAAVNVGQDISHYEAGNLRSAGLPSTTIDGGGTVYVSWPDCRFRTGCSSNDIVYSTSTDGVTWSQVVRIPIDPVTSTVDHFIHGMGADLRTAGSSAHLAVTYYYYPVSNCGNSCQLYAGFSSSTNGGQTWTSGVQLSASMQLSWLPNTFSGRMVADYVATVFPVGGRAFPIYAIAYAPTGSLFHEAIYTDGYGFILGQGQQFSSANDKTVPNAKSDHGPREYYDLDNEKPIHPSEKTPPHDDRD